MSSSPWVSCWAMTSAVLLGIACERSPAVQVFGESVRVERSAPSPRTSAIFDGTRVSLVAARGETLGVEVRIADRRTRAVRLELAGDGVRVNAFEVRSVAVKEPSTSMYGRSTGSGLYPDALVPAKAGSLSTDDLAYFDVEVARQARPGRYSGRLEIGERTVPVELEVAKASLDLGDEPLVWVFYLPREIARVHGLSDGESPELVAREATYHELFRSHGAFLAADLPPARFEARRRFVTRVRYWPVFVDSSSDAAIERDVHAWLELFRGTGVTPFVIPVDEPRTDAARERARHIAEVIGRSGGGRPWLLRAVTDEPRASYGDVFDVYFSPKSFGHDLGARRARGERFFTYNGKPPEAGSMILDTDGVALRTWGWIAERYEIGLWYAWEGLYFSDRYNGGGPTDVMVDPLTFDERSRGGSDFGNGDGLLAYPGPLPSLRLKALRRGLQDRLLVRQLERCGGTVEARGLVERMVPRALGDARGAEPSWSLDETVWEGARRELLRRIEVLCHEDDLAR
jgi:hypothetical protein